MYKNTNKIRESIKDEFIDALSQPQGLWERGWRIMPQERAASGVEYKGLNALYLTMVADKKKYEDYRWYTYQQVKTLDSKNPNTSIYVRKGEKGSYVEWWYNYLKQGLMSDDEYHKLLDEAYKTLGKGKNYRHQNIFNSVEKEKLKMALNLKNDDFGMNSKNYTVFNGSQIEGLELPYQTNIKIGKVELAMNVIENYCMTENMTISYSSAGRAYYSFSNDTITMPPRDTFVDEEHYVSTLIHEMCHSTGAATRLNRDFETLNDNDAARAIEEMRAELACVFLCNELNVPLDQQHIDNHKSYVQSWYNAINDEKYGDKQLFDTIKEAETIVDYIKDKGLYNQCVREMQNNKEIELLGNIDLTNVEKNVSLLLHCYSNKNDIEYLEVNINSDDKWDYSLYDSNGILIDGGIDDCDNLIEMIGAIADENELVHLSICHSDLELGEIYYEADKELLSMIMDKTYSHEFKEQEETLLNTKSALNCDYKDDLKHCKENEEMLTKLSKYEDCIVDVTYTIDNSNGIDTKKIDSMSLGDALRLRIASDTDIGIDFTINQNKDLVLRCHGQYFNEDKSQKHAVTDILIKSSSKDDNGIDFEEVLTKVKEQVNNVTRTLKI